ncbi:hypothetical protein SERLA73DRAFT_191640 [Serpula lacrymans var. lacrymans S7.3]|uniref:YMC020W-like alpha/beta hydrolase domain-containing protein n=2 Tax=Serpula lacrymans var. lacrymans TaxID=341189 RepID=F8QI02_SERL3|nr:uncharacterized protein SERLADRAFT_459634 [Serpula lacrymans var. lacrymans S7.9]EGN92065.1 hypothetical protein SERLA73DRAFT_191640 [Serpula lacrymans var. lacrymans S7.3]EGO28815.1 hypothetical protein SERLADRAFT_459634 [Serpula lacrymans var. lacrymans S7.9]
MLGGLDALQESHNLPLNDESADGPTSTVNVENSSGTAQAASIGAAEGQDPSGEVLPGHSTDPSHTQGTMWYTPWSWYNTSASATEEKFPKTSVPIKGDDANTESNLLKEDTLSRGDESVLEVPAPSQGQQVDVVRAVEEHNPIESTITTNRSGWMSFFSSKALTTKRITTNETDENGMEVMNLDEEDSQAETGTQPLPQDIPAKDAKISDSPAKQSAPPSSVRKADNATSPLNPPLANSESVKRELVKRQPSPTPSKKSSMKAPVSPARPNLVLPTWTDTFHTAPRSSVPPPPASALTKTFKYVSGVLFAREDDAQKKGKGKAKDTLASDFGKALPRAWDVLEGKIEPDILKGCNKVVVIGVHGWFPGAVMRTVLGEPTGTSGKFVNMMVQALEEFQDKHQVKLHKITKIPLEGEGTISRRVDKLYQNLIQNEDWMKDLREADVIFVATHSQGCIVSTHLLNRLIIDRHIRTSRNVDVVDAAGPVASGSVGIIPSQQPQRICCLALCGVHLGPLRYLSTSSLLQPYIQYFESTAARELFEFQNTESQTSQDYVKSLGNVLSHGIKMVYVASLNDQVVGLYSGLFTSITHPLILRAMYIDGDAYHSSDFLSNLLVLLLRLRNSGLSDSGLLAHLSESTAGSLNGVGHSTAYEELATYSLAVNYLFLADNGMEHQPEMEFEPFNALNERNDYEIPWALRDLIADERVAHFFSDEFVRLRDAFRDWQPKTAILRDVKRKLQPIQRLSSAMITTYSNSISKL